MRLLPIPIQLPLTDASDVLTAVSLIRTVTPMMPYLATGQLYIQGGNPASTLITEMWRTWDDGPQGTREEWLFSPKLTLPPYSLPQSAVAVLISLKAKVLTKTWANHMCDGAIQMSVRALDNLDPVNSIAYARTSKPGGCGRNTLGGGRFGLTTENISNVLIPVRLVEGRFDLYTSVSIYNNVLIEQAVFLVGYFNSAAAPVAQSSTMIPWLPVASSLLNLMTYHS